MLLLKRATWACSWACFVFVSPRAPVGQLSVQILNTTSTAHWHVATWFWGQLAANHERVEKRALVHQRGL